MAETPINPESGAATSGTAPEDGTAAQPSTDNSLPPDAALADEAVADQALADEAAAAAPAAATPDVEIAAPEPSLPEPVAAPQEAAPEAAAEPAAPAASEPTSQPPGVAATITVPPLESTESSGGEWELLVERFNTWWASGELNRQWQRIRGPLKGVAILVAVLLALQVYATVVGTIDGIPLVSGLLELTGLIAALQFSYRRLLRSSDRQAVFEQLQRRWLDFRGRN